VRCPGRLKSFSWGGPTVFIVSCAASALLEATKMKARAAPESLRRLFGI
jgi:hypothetical protein